MASRQFEQFHFALEKYVVELYGNLNIGAAGAVSSIQGGGILSIAKQAAAGKYLITLQDQYYRFLMFKAIAVLASGFSGIQTIEVLQAPATLQADFLASPAFLIQCYDAAGVAVNPASGTDIMFNLTVRNTNVGPYDV